MSSSNSRKRDNGKRHEHQESSVPHILERAYNRVEYAISTYFTGLVVIGLILTIIYELSIRVVINKSLIGLPEVAELLVVIITFTTLATVQRENAHITMDTILIMLMKRGRIGIVVKAFNTLAAIALFIFIFYVLGQYDLHAYQSRYSTQTIYLPVWPIYLIATLGALLMVFRLGIQLRYLLYNITRNPKASGEELEKREDEYSI
jgi:TRAP-type C4-dicarboxylate transport system permease small subunit